MKQYKCKCIDCVSLIKVNNHWECEKSLGNLENLSELGEAIINDPHKDRYCSEYFPKD